jgi:catechol 2,3-dioxygenase-like lactoylglutathione lyase family enzyme
MPPDTATERETASLGTLSSTLIQTPDLERTLAFYRDKLGLDVQAGGDGWAVLDGGSGTLVLVRASQREVVMAFTGGDLGKAREVMQARGANPTEREAHPGGEHFFVTDPEGNRVMISN